MIDLKKAKEFYAEYVKMYDSSNGKIGLKIRHIYRVAEISRNVAEKIGLNDEDKDLAELIGLLHDIGRFEQVKKYNTFMDHKSENHAVLGVKELFEKGIIQNFVEDRRYDEIIRTAILNHNKDKIEEGLDDKTNLFCKIIRDSDKLDIYYVLLNEFADSYSKLDFSDDVVTDEIYREFMENHCIDFKKRETCADTMVAHLGYVFDFNFDDSLKQVYENKYIEKLVEKANYKNEETIDRFNKMLECANRYIEKRLNLVNQK